MLKIKTQTLDQKEEVVSNPIEFLRSILVEAFESESWRNACHQLAFISHNFRYSTWTHDEITNVTSELFKTFSTDKKYCVALNMVGDETDLDDNPPFYLTIIAREDNSVKYTNLNEKLYQVAKQTNVFKYIHGHASRDLSHCPNQFVRLVEVIELTDNNIKFLKDILKASHKSIELLSKVEEKIQQANEADRGYQTLIRCLNNIKVVAPLDKNVPFDEETAYFWENDLKFSNEATYVQLQERCQDVSAIYLKIKPEDYKVLVAYFAKQLTPEKIRVYLEEPLVVAIKFSNYEYFETAILDSLLFKNVNELVKSACEKRLGNIDEVRKNFSLLYKNKVNSYYQRVFSYGLERSYVTIQFGLKAKVFIEGLQSYSETYGVQCASSYFLKDQLSFIQEAINKITNLVLPCDIFGHLSADELLIDMEFCNIDGNYIFRLSELDNNGNQIFKGWDFGLKFVDIDEGLKQIYLDQGKKVAGTDVSLIIPLPNLALYCLINYVKRENISSQDFNDYLKVAKNLLLKFNLCLPKKYHQMFFESSIIGEIDKQKILERYKECYEEQQKQSKYVHKSIQEHVYKKSMQDQSGAGHRDNNLSISMGKFISSTHDSNNNNALTTESTTFQR